MAQRKWSLPAFESPFRQKRKTLGRSWSRAFLPGYRPSHHTSRKTQARMVNFSFFRAYRGGRVRDELAALAADGARDADDPRRRYAGVLAEAFGLLEFQAVDRVRRLGTLLALSLIHI